jgi:hypothetical protein
MVTPLEELDELRAQIDAHRPFTADLVETLQNHLVPRYLYCSSALGKRSCLSELEMTTFLEREIVTGGHPLDRFLGAHRHLDAFEFVESRAREGLPIDLAFAREIHHRLTSESRSSMVRPGQWRDHEHPSAKRGERTFAHTEPSAIPEQMKQLMSGLNERLERRPIPEAVAWLYYQFHLIHPFGSENGAVVRLLATAALMHEGFPPLIIEPEQVGELLESLAACAPAGGADVRALEGGEDVSPLARMVGKCLVRTASELLDLIEGRAITSAKDLARQVPEDQQRVLEHVIKSPSTSWRVRGGFEVRTLHERLRRLASLTACSGPLYELKLEGGEIGARHRFAGTRLGHKLPAADAGIVGDLVLEIRGNADTGLRMPPPFRLQLLIAGSKLGLHVFVHWQDQEKVTEHHGPGRAVEWAEKDLNRLLVQELDDRRRRFELLLLDENLAPAAQTRIREALDLRPGQAPRRRTGSFNRKFMVERRPPPAIPPAQPVAQSPKRERPLSGKTTLRPDERGCPSCHLSVKTGQGLTCPDCEAVYHEACLARLPGCLTPTCMARRKRAMTPRKVSGKSSRATIDGLRPSEPPLSF